MTYREACPYCNRIFYDVSDFAHHLAVIHPKSLEAKDEPIEFED